MLSALITGAAGSIGSALLRHLQASGARVVGIDLEVDIRNRLNLRRVFERVRPDVVFHAAALKHVPALESQPFAAVETNVFGSVNVACAAREARIGSVLLLSTDKAVNPVSIMGKTKRLAEAVFQSIESPSTRFITVRLGNVVGSSGSVFPIFEEQIRRGGPVTVTHRDMQRYFLTSDAAVRTLLAAANVGCQHEVCVPELGEPRSILAIAEELIAGRPIPIEWTGIRPGEKLSEELWDPSREQLLRKEDNLAIYRPYETQTNIWDRLETLRRCWAARDRSRLLTLLDDCSANL